MTGFGLFWFAFALLQMWVAAFVLASALRFRGERLWPSRAQPLGRGVQAFIAAGVALVAAPLWLVGDVEFARWMGTGSVMVAMLASMVVLLRRVARDEAQKLAAERSEGERGR